MSEYFQDEYEMCRDIHDIIKLKGWEFLIDRLHLLAKYGYEHETLEAALFATLVFAKRCDRQTEKSGLFPPEYSSD